MKYNIEEVATIENFDEQAYLAANPDVAGAVTKSEFKSGWHHFESCGKNESRMQRHSSDIIGEAKKKKLKNIKPLLREDIQYVEKDGYYDFLTKQLRGEFNIIDTDAVSSNGYDGHVIQLIQKHTDGFVLDCGAGKRPTYYDNVVNFEIVPYDTTDVRGVGEVLPFRDNSFDGVISIAVLEHVKDPFRCAKEIARVLKPNGDLICCVPFLQPLHGYPHHYYNMTHQGLRNLFEGLTTIDNIEVYESVLPVWSLNWILRSWADGLSGEIKEEFLDMKISDLLEPAATYLDRPFVRNLSKDKNLELASACVLFARKK